ncbi:MAG: hypothetical protein SGI83_19460 [Bacteroidota bacterium]|nr:hypothetical protein [Bacteroidota bacterium]
MKKILSLTVLFAALGFMACNNEKKGDKADVKTDKPQKVEDPSKPAEAQTAVTKIHSCGADCKDGNHVYAHNQVGHTCTDVCGAAHVCVAKCKDGQHEYVHGESGHTCTDDCTKI